MEGAIADFTKAIELNPGNAQAYLARAGAKCSKKDWDNAITDYTMAIALVSGNTSIHYFYYRGYAKRKKGDLDSAVADYTKARQLASDDSAVPQVPVPSPGYTAIPSADVPTTTISGKPVTDGLNIVGVNAKVMKTGVEYLYIAWKVTLTIRALTPSITFF